MEKQIGHCAVYRTNITCSNSRIVSPEDSSQGVGLTFPLWAKIGYAGTMLYHSRALPTKNDEIWLTNTKDKIVWRGYEAFNSLDKTMRFPGIFRFEFKWFINRLVPLCIYKLIDLGQFIG